MSLRQVVVCDLCSKEFVVGLNDTVREACDKQGWIRDEDEYGVQDNHFCSLDCQELYLDAGLSSQDQGDGDAE